jgi:starch synthase
MLSQKVGGLADVVGALPKYQAGHLTRIFLVMILSLKENKFECVHWGFVKFVDFHVLKETTDKLGFELYLIEIPELFGRKDVYGYKDDIERFVSFKNSYLDLAVMKCPM